MSEIVNRVAQSKLMTLDLEEFYPEGTRLQIDVKDWLFQGLVLKEKEFRNQIAEHKWEQYEDAYVALYCSTEAIIPGWAFMLISTKLQPYAKKVVLGSLEDLETIIFKSIIEELNVSDFKDKPVIIKGCSNKPIPPNAYLWATIKLQPVAKSIMYGEACSSVPLFKRK